MLDLRYRVEKARLAFRRAMDKGDPKEMEAASRDLLAARSAVERHVQEQMIAVRKILTDEQYRKVRQWLHRRRGARRRHERRGGALRHNRPEGPPPREPAGF